MRDSDRLSRRVLLGAGVAALAFGRVDLGAAEVKTRENTDAWRGLKFGAASYSFRKLPVEAAVKATQRVGLAYVSIKDFHLPMNSSAEQRKAVAGQFKEAGITPLSVGVVSFDADEKKSRNAFEYARDVGAPTIVASPTPQALSLCEKLVKEFDIKLAIHNHGPEDQQKFPSPYDVMKAIENLDPRIGYCIDVGHTARAGVDPAEAIERCKDRLYDIHLKDLARVDRRNMEIECGRGVLDLKGILGALAKVKFGGHVGFEHEKDPNDPLPGLAESVGYVRGLIGAV
jgi:sugar phosphate isomerase/epimerase